MIVAFLIFSHRLTGAITSQWKPQSVADPLNGEVKD
jgi:hypothetical protein